MLKFIFENLEEFRLGKLNLSAEEKESYEKLAKIDIFLAWIKKLLWLYLIMPLFFKKSNILKIV